jgi:hypothetical protein
LDRRLLAAILTIGALVILGLVGYMSGDGIANAYYYYYYSAPGPPASLTLAPSTATNTVGTTHTLTATVTDSSGTAVPSVAVRFSVTGAVTTSGQCTTDASGMCTFTYTGPTAPGSDTISAFADSNGNTTADTGEPTATATKTWVHGPAANLVLTPAVATNTVGTSHTVTATVTDRFTNPISGAVVNFTVTGSVSTTGQCTTLSSGQCTFSYSGPLFPGADLISGVVGTSGPTATAMKSWVLPPSTPGHVTGGGQILKDSGNTVAFGFDVNHTTKNIKGECNVINLSPKRMIRCVDVSTLVVNGNTATFYGHAVDSGSSTGAGTTFVIKVVDNGEPGTADTFSITTASGFSAGGTLSGGNIQVH